MTLDLEKAAAGENSDDDTAAIGDLCHRLEALWCCGGLICDATCEADQSDLRRAERLEQLAKIKQLHEFIGEAIPNGKE